MLTENQKTRRLILEMERNRIQAEAFVANANMAFWRTFFIAVVVQAAILFSVIWWGTP